MAKPASTSKTPELSAEQASTSKTPELIAEQAFTSKMAELMAEQACTSKAPKQDETKSYFLPFKVTLGGDQWSEFVKDSTKANFTGKDFWPKWIKGLSETYSFFGDDTIIQAIAKQIVILSRFFASFSTLSQVFRDFRTCSDLFGCARMHSDAFRCIWMRSDASKKTFGKCC